MIPIYRQTILDIDITNACPHRCSNCTRLSGHFRKPYFMGIEDFKKAIGASRKYPGLIAIMGGEPCIHPKFREITEFFADNYGGPRRNNGVMPIANLIEYRNTTMSRVIGNKRGLFTSMGDRFYDNYELIMEAYDFLGLNDHQHDGEHQAILVASKELPISEEVRRANIDKCWINAKWSAVVNQAGAYFCEIAGTMDLLFDGGKRAWKVEDNWWMREPREWKEQMFWCDYCGAAQNTPSRRAKDGIDDISPEMVEMLKKAGSNKIRRGNYRVFLPSQYDATKMAARPMEPYLPNGNNKLRIAPNNTCIYPKKLEGVVVSVGCADFLDLTLGWNIKHFDKFVVVTGSADVDTQNVAKKYGATLVISDRYKENRASLNKGKLVNDGVANLDYDDWVLLTDADILLPSNFRAEFNKYVWNPGILYYATRLHTPMNDHEWVRRYQKDERLIKTLKFTHPPTNRMPWGYFQLFNCRAKVLSKLGTKISSEDFQSAGGIDKHFLERWPSHRRQLAPFTVIHMAHGKMGENWTGRNTPPLHFKPTNPVKSTGWLNIGWIDENGYNETFPKKPWGGFVKIARIDTGEYVIGIYMPPPRGNFLMRGPDSNGAHHSGIISEIHRVTFAKANIGKAIIHTENRPFHVGIRPTIRCEKSKKIYASSGKEFSGWGVGHPLASEAGQVCVWNGQIIPRTNFDVFWSNKITDEERLHLVRR